MATRCGRSSFPFIIGLGFFRDDCRVARAMKKRAQPSMPRGRNVGAARTGEQHWDNNSITKSGERFVHAVALRRRTARSNETSPARGSMAARENAWISRANGSHRPRWMHGWNPGRESCVLTSSRPARPSTPSVQRATAAKKMRPPADTTPDSCHNSSPYSTAAVLYAICDNLIRKGHRIR